MPVVVPSSNGWYEVLVDRRDAPDLLGLLDAGVKLVVNDTEYGLRPILLERGPDGKGTTISLMKALLRAGPTEETRCLNGNTLDCRRSNWRLEDTGIIRVWNSKLLGVKAVRGG